MWHFIKFYVRHPIWFFTRFVWLYVENPFKAPYRKKRNNINIYDGLTENDFKAGHLITFLCQLGVLYSGCDNDHSWSYWDPRS